MRGRPSLALAAALLACGCARSIDQYCEAYYEALSIHDQGCGAPPDMAQARWSFAKAFYCPSAVRLLAASEISYDAAQGDACLQRIHASGCLPTQPLGGSDPCALAIVGRVGLGESCYDGRECAPGTICQGASCPAVCQKLPALGQACSGACEAGASCAKSVCVAPAGQGEGCVSPDEPGCGDGLWCGALSHLCREVGAIASGSCEGPQDCALGSLCVGVNTSSEVAGSCAAAKVTNEACAPGECAGGSFCNAGTCAPLPRLGEACGDTASCALGWCDPVSGLCRAFVAAGGSCAQDEPCAPFTSCDSGTGTCLAQCAPP